MTTGVCRIEDGHLTAINQAVQLLVVRHGPAGGHRANESIAGDYCRWQAGRHAPANPFKVHPEGKPCCPSWRIGHDFEPETLLFVEDFTLAEAAQTLS